ncbi:MAG: hypothetical protein IKO93_11065, partial [Lentisphaeria bacterium]|nr:hypothetical protein [Lentisphaeria bacterium]
CLTGNNFQWWRDKAEKVANDAVSKTAHYTLTLSPDHLKDGHKLTFKFDSGNLTNRAKAFTAGDLFNELKNRFIIREGKIRLDMFADTFSREDAFQIRIDFGKKVPARRVKIFWSGTLPEITVTTPDGRKAVIPAGKTPDVRMSETALGTGAPVSSLVLSLGARPKGEKLVLSEIEVWD